jgi:mannose-1-phosphate guanylyltransferase / mannose-6-phosphate isomerase
MLVFRASVFFDELQRLEPEIHEAASELSTPDVPPERIKAAYSRMRTVSIDYGVMERSNRVAVIPADLGWSDLGTWRAVYEDKSKDSNANVLEGSVVACDTYSSLLLAQKGMIGAVGLENIIVVQTGDAVLVAPRDRAQDVKKIVDKFQGTRSPTIEETGTVHRPWGTYTVLEEGLGYKIKRIVVDPGQRLSLQRHARRAEHWVVIQGMAKVRRGDSEFDLSPNESAYIPRGELHRLENPSSESLIIIEVQTGDYVGEDDIERYEDIYGRPTRSIGTP